MNLDTKPINYYMRAASGLVFGVPRKATFALYDLCFRKTIVPEKADGVLVWLKWS